MPMEDNAHSMQEYISEQPKHDAGKTIIILPGISTITAVILLIRPHSLTAVTSMRCCPVEFSVSVVVVLVLTTC